MIPRRHPNDWPVAATWRPSFVLRTWTNARHLRMAIQKTQNPLIQVGRDKKNASCYLQQAIDRSPVVPTRAVESSALKTLRSCAVFEGFPVDWKLSNKLVGLSVIVVGLRGRPFLHNISRTLTNAILHVTLQPGPLRIVLAAYAWDAHPSEIVHCHHYTIRGVCLGSGDVCLRLST